mgnify:CR=1 FL=1
MKGRHEPCHDFWRVALGIKCDEQNLQLVGIRSQRLHDAAHVGQGRWADIRAVRITEKNKDELATKIYHGPRLAVVIGERKILAVVEARDIGIGKHRFRQGHAFVIAGRQGQRTSQNPG